MDPALLVDRQRLVEQVHQHRLAAPDAAPQVDAARPARGLRNSCEQAARRLGFELALQRVEPLGGRRLLGIGPQFAGGDQRVVAGKHSAHQSRGRIASYLGRSGSKRSQPTASFM